MDWQNLEHNSQLEQDPIWIDARQAFQSDTVDHHPQPEDLSNLDAYVYQPLKEAKREIRVLTLRRSRILSDEDESIVCGSLQKISLNSDPFFFALSYCWGDASQWFPIILDGKIFNVTANLYGTLKQLRKMGHGLPIWIDAICINQTDEVEKSSQLQEMGNIYREAQLVLGWLGPEADSSSLAIKALSFLGMQAMDMPDGPSIQERYDLVSQTLPSDPSDERLAFPTSSVVALLNRPWWCRVWVVQEVVLAKNVYLFCGDIDVQYMFLVLGFTMIFELPALNAAFQGALESQIIPLLPVLKCNPRLMNAAIRGHNQEPSPLRQRLIETNSLGATDPKDHILALLGMVSDADEVGIKPDCSKTCVDVYTQVATGLMIAQRNLQILSQCSLPKKQIGLPSWVPDFSAKAASPIWQPKFPLFRTGGEHTQRTKIHHGNFVVSGSRFDVVKDISFSWNETDLVAEPEIEGIVLSGCLEAIENVIRVNCTAYHSPNEIYDAVWRTPIADSESGVFSETGRRTIRATARMRGAFEALRYPENPTNNSGEHSKAQQIAASSLYKAGMIHTLSNRRIFLTEKGYVGVGPSHLQAGDHICILWGAEVPFILRERRGVDHAGKNWFWQRDKAHFELVGECYVHGIMDGEGDNSTSVDGDFILH